VKSDGGHGGEQKEDIWLKKFNFTFGTTFGHISDGARTKRGSTSAPKWNGTQSKDQRIYGQSARCRGECQRDSRFQHQALRHHGTDSDIGQTDKSRVG
jgi:hypothetical protein